MSYNNDKRPHCPEAEVPTMAVAIVVNSFAIVVNSLHNWLITTACNYPLFSGSISQLPSQRNCSDDISPFHPSVQ